MYDNDYKYNMNLERTIQDIYTKASKSKYMNWSCPKCKIKAVVLKDSFDYKCTECFYQEDKQSKQKNMKYKKEIDNSIEHIIYTKEVFTNLISLFKIDTDYTYLTNQKSDVEIDFNNIFNRTKSINKIICTINRININELKNTKSIFIHFILKPKLSIFSINEPMEKIHDIVGDNCEIIWETTSEYIQNSKVVIYYQ
ncbi:MAG: hypothetical protein C0626_00685 [Arcobacter sp.]|uniref:hypothetical protein n=1 Tax=uncultured Arcobacter sp. TaxID=165434 RepID=UPI000CC4DFD8|nr:hypothetical protein [uncultured Arcobacter sp.]PLY11118.1 MAG: hypothetical protein C0626_00685 [Arcobacter sp.]